MSYGNPGYTPGGGVPPTPSSPINGTLILIFGIVGLLVCQIFAPIAWVMGNNAVKMPGAPPDQVNLANIGRILGIIGTVFMVLGFIWFVFIGGAAMLQGAGRGMSGGMGAGSRIPSILPF